MLQTTAVVQSSLQSRAQAFVLPFRDVGIADVSLVGAKNASWGELLQQPLSRGITVSDGFSTTACAYRYFIEIDGLEAKRHHLFAELRLSATAKDLPDASFAGQQETYLNVYGANT